MNGELQALADKVVAQAQAGEQIEAYVSRGGETEVRVYDGEVEHFVSAQSEGLGVRVIRDGRTGFAYAGTLDPSAVDEVLAEARDNVTFGTVDEWAGLAEPDGVPRTEQPLWNDELAAFPTERKIELAKQLERLTLATDPRVRVDDANYADAWGEVAVATTTGIRESGRENGCYVSVSSLADDGDETQTGFGFSVARQPGGFDLDKAANDAADRATRLLGATKPATKRLTVVLDPFVTAQFLGVISSTLNGESVVKGRSLFRDRLGEQVAADIVTLVDDPTNPDAYTATELDGEGLAARRNVLITDGVLQQFVHATYSARRAGTVSTGNATRAGFAGTPGVGCLALQLQPGTRSQVELIADVDDGLLVQSVAGLHSGVNSVSGDFSTGASGMLITNGTVGAPVRELTIASTLQRMLLDIVEIGGDVDWLPMRAARRQPGHPRRHDERLPDHRLSARQRHDLPGGWGPEHEAIAGPHQPDASLDDRRLTRVESPRRTGGRIPQRDTCSIRGCGRHQTPVGRHGRARGRERRARRGVPGDKKDRRQPIALDATGDDRPVVVPARAADLHTAPGDLDDRPDLTRLVDADELGQVAPGGHGVVAFDHRGVPRHDVGELERVDVDAVDAATDVGVDELELPVAVAQERQPVLVQPHGEEVLRPSRVVTTVVGDGHDLARLDVEDPDVGVEAGHPVDASVERHHRSVR